MALDLHARRLWRLYRYADQIGCDRTLSGGRPASIPRFHDNRASIKMLPVELPTTHRQHGIITLKEPSAEPPGAALHRMRPRDREAVDKEKMKGAMSGYGSAPRRRGSPVEEIPPRELSIDLVADERLRRVTGRAAISKFP